MRLRANPVYILIFTLLAISSTISFAQDADDEQLEEVIVTGAVRTGGAQDISYARSEVLSGRIPHPDSITAEGLLNQYDLALAPKGSCQQLFCIFGEVVRSNLVSKPSDEYLAGLSFATNIDGEKWQRKASNIVVVVDKSGSMSGRPLDLVKESLNSLVGELGPNDSLSIVLYGDRAHLYLPPHKLEKKHRDKVLKAIHAIESSGSTNMERGLKIGYKLATELKSESNNQTRVILFTDERPNVGATQAGSFIAMATEASKQGVGLTTIGVGVQFDAALAHSIGSARGGNLFYVSDEESAKTIFAEELDFMISELAHDLRFVVRPHPGLRLTGVYGVPGDILNWGDNGSVEFTVPTVFLSTRGGGIYTTLARSLSSNNLPSPDLGQGEPIVDVEISYAPINGERQTDKIQVSELGTQSPDTINQVSILLDQFIGLKAAMTEHHIHNDQENAYQIINRLNQRLQQIDSKELKKSLAQEATLVAKLTEKLAYLSGHTSEVTSSSESKLWGIWKVISRRGKFNYERVKRNHFFVFSPDNQLLMVTKDQLAELDWDSASSFVPTKAKLVFEEDYLSYRYKIKDDTLIISNRVKGTRARIKLKHYGDFTSSVPIDSAQSQ